MDEEVVRKTYEWKRVSDTRVRIHTQKSGSHPCQPRVHQEEDMHAACAFCLCFGMGESFVSVVSCVRVSVCACVFVCVCVFIFFVVFGDFF